MRQNAGIPAYIYFLKETYNDIVEYIMGGGGGGGRGLTPDELKKLEQRAKKTLKNGSGESKVNAFISFSSDDLAEVNLLRGQAKNSNNEIEFNDWSLKVPFNSKKAEYIKNGIRERIRQSSVTVVYVSENTVSSAWVNWEVNETIAMGKGVIAMHKGDSPPSQLPQAVIDNKIPVVPWNQKVLAKAIKQHSNR